MAIKISGSNIIDDNRHIVSAGVITATRAVIGTGATITSGGIDAVGLAITTTTIKVGTAISITDGAIAATRFYGDGTGLSNTGSTLSAASGSQRVVVTSQTTGTMTASSTDADLTFDASTNTLAVGGNLELGHATDTTISRASAGRIAVEGVNVVTTSSTDTLTNKTLTTPAIGSGGLTLAGSTAGTTTVVAPAAASGTATFFGGSDTVAGIASAQTLTNKSIALGSNTITGTIAQFNTAVTDADFATLAGTETLTNKTLTSPTLTTPALGTPSSGTLTNCSGLPVSAITASTSTALGVGSVELGHATDTTISRVSAGVVAIEGVNVVTTSSTDTLTNKTLTSPTLTTPVLGTPASGTLTSCTGLPVSTGISGLAAGAATFLATPSSANLATLLTDETGSGANVFATSPSLTTPSITAPTITGSITAANINSSGIVTGTQLSSGASGVGINITTQITGPAEIVIDPAAVGDNTGSVRIKGDLYVDGTQTVINSTALELADLNIGIASAISTNALLDGGGIGIGSVSIRKTITWNNTASSLKSSENWDIATGKTYMVNGTTVLSASQVLGKTIGGTSAGDIVDLGTAQTLTNKTLTSPTLTTPVLGTPSSGTLTNCTGLPISSGVSGLAAGAATFLATPSSANLATLLTDETGTGANVFATSPTLVTPVLGTPSSGTLTNCTGLPISGLTASTSTALGVGTLELGHATDTTLSRSAAGTVQIEGVTVATESNTLTFTNKTLTAFGETVYSFGNTGTAPTLTLSNGNFITATLTGNATFVFSMTSVPSGAYSFTLVLENDGTAGRSITWPASVKWPNNTVPTRTTTANKTDVYTFFTYDGGSEWYGNLSLYNFS